MRVLVSLIFVGVLLMNTAPAWAGISIIINHVPEPTSLALLAVGLGGVALARFRRRRRK